MELSSVKQHLRLDPDLTYDDSTIQSFIDVAVEDVLNLTGRSFLPTVYALKMGDWYDLELPKPPFVSISSITYVDSNGDVQTLPEERYEIIERDSSDSVFIEFETSASISSTVDLPITINYSAGYADADAIPSAIKIYIKMVVSDLYDVGRSTTFQGAFTMRENPTARRLISPFIVSSGHYYKYEI